MKKSKYRSQFPEVSKIMPDKLGRPVPVFKIGRNGQFAAKIRKQYVYPQAENVIRKFGSAYKLAKALIQAFGDEGLTINPSTIYRWAYPVEAGGSGGHIPEYWLKKIVVAARIEGIYLDPLDLTPKFIRTRVVE